MQLGAQYSCVAATYPALESAAAWHTPRTMRILTFGCAICAMTLGCNTQSAPQPSPSAVPTVAPTPPQPSAATAPPTKDPIAPSDKAPMPDPITHPCVVTAAQYENAIEKGKTDCKADSDCGCYQGGISRKSGCGGVLNKESLKELTRIATEFRKDRCEDSQECAAWACQPKCVNGQCKK
jgi:hypothetical protein